MKRVGSHSSLSASVSVAGVSELQPGMRRSKSDSFLSERTKRSSLSRKQLKTVIFFKKKIQKHGKTIINRLQDFQFANEMSTSDDILKSLILTTFMICTIDNEEEKKHRTLFIIGSMLLLGLAKKVVLQDV